MNRFPPKLIERCKMAITRAIDAANPDDTVGNVIVPALLRESGHAELVAALKVFVMYDIPGFSNLREESREALRKAGAL